MCVMTRRIYPVLNTDSTTAGTDSVRPSVHHMVPLLRIDTIDALVN